MHLRAPVIVNGVCVRWRGWLDLERLEGAGRLEFDEEAAAAEDALLRSQVDIYERRLREIEEHRKRYDQHVQQQLGKEAATTDVTAAQAKVAY